jgi:two-component system OmpR family sensor kinase
LLNRNSIRFRSALWYSGVLASSLLLSGLCVYFGLKQYLDWSFKSSLLNQAHLIGEKLLTSVETRGEPYVVGEIDELAPEVSNRMIRVLREDHTKLYESAAPRNGSFDPSKINVLITPREHQNLFPISNRGTLVVESVPFVSPGGHHFQIEVGASYSEIATVLHGLLIAYALGTPLVLVLAIVGGYLLMRNALMPLTEIAERAERISSRNLDERLPVAKTGDELERLSLSLNRMIFRLQQSFEHVSRFSADVAHELRTPLTILRGELEAMAQENRLSATLREAIGSTLEEISRMTSIVENLLSISRLDAGKDALQFGPVDLGKLAVSTAEQMRLLADEKMISLEYHVGPVVMVCGDEGRLRQVVVNLLSNAIAHTLPGGLVEITTFGEKQIGVLQVKDDGSGIPRASLPLVFERFYRSDKARSRSSGGAGLGLSIVKAICTAHGGDIEITSVEGEGTCVVVRLPASIGRETFLNARTNVERKEARLA